MVNTMSIAKQTPEGMDFIDLQKFSSEVIDDDSHTFWLFAYGLLLWYPDFEADERILGYVDNVKRKLCHASHMLGDDSWPGRVASLVHAPGERTWGAVYKLSDRRNKIATFDKLCNREISEGYRLAMVNFVPINSPGIIRAAVFVTDPSANRSLVEVTLPWQAYQIFCAHGIHGPNRTYVYKIADFLKTEIVPLYPEDLGARQDDSILLSTLVQEFESNQREISPEEAQSMKPQILPAN
ncbi:unnamed protein product [Dicrocoelium dendriticum]|nr:unnamed protein product [Dicrocoelium dendriticum]